MRFLTREFLSFIYSSSTIVQMININTIVILIITKELTFPNFLSKSPAFKLLLPKYHNAKYGSVDV